MIELLLNQIRQQAQLVLSNVAFTRLGTITAYDPQTYTAQVKIQPEDQENPNNTVTSFLPIVSTWVGNGWGMFAPPTVGSSCIVHFLEGSHASPFISLNIFTEEFKSLNVPEGEFWIVHKEGSYIKLENNGNITVKGKNVIIDGEVNINIGNQTVGNLKKLLQESAAMVYNTHTHPANGSPPDQLITSSDFTTYTQAN